MSVLISLLLAAFIVVSILLIIIVLLQPHHSESGLAGAFGGGGGDSFLGTKTVTVATRITVILSIIFLILAVVIHKLPRGSASVMEQYKTPPAAPATGQNPETKPPQAPATGTTQPPATPPASEGNKIPTEQPITR